MRKLAIVLGCLASALFPAFDVCAGEASLGPCVPKANTNDSALCPIEVFPPATVRDVSLREAGANITDGAKYLGSEAAGISHAVGFLLTEGGEATPREFGRLKSVINATLNTRPANTNMALWAYSANLRTIAPFGTAPETIAYALDNVQPKGKTVELLRSINEAAKQLAAVPSAHKTLIVATLSDFDDTAYSPSDVIATLKASGIRPIFVFPQSGDRALTDAQSLRRISDEAGGAFLQASDKAGVQRAVDFVKTYIEQSGAIVVARSDAPRVLQVELSDRKTLSAEIAAIDKTPAPEPAPASAQDLQQPTPFLASPARWFSEQTLWMQIALAGGVAAALLLLVTLVLRKRRDQAVAAAPGVVADIRPVLAWLDFLDSGESKEPISQEVTRVGRQSDNDLVLSNSSVHRHHALIKHEKSGRFSIMDLDTDNGVLVNGKREAIAPLGDGDTIELGEVRMRFRKA